MTPDQILYEVPDSIFALDSADINFLENLKDDCLEEMSDYLDAENLTMQSGYTYIHLNKLDFIDYNNIPFFTKLANLFPGTCNGTLDGSAGTLDGVFNNLQLVRVTGELKIHVDYRACVLTIPLVDLVKPITFWSSRDDDKEIWHQYHYTKYRPVLENSHVEHNVIDNDEDRIFLQLGGFKDTNGEDFNSIKSLITS